MPSDDYTDIDATAVLRYSAALHCEAAAVRTLTDLMSQKPIPEEEFRAANEVYQEILKERKAALKALEASGMLDVLKEEKDIR